MSIALVRLRFRLKPLVGSSVLLLTKLDDIRILPGTTAGIKDKPVLRDLCGGMSWHEL